ncbi:hypothetical protein [Streptomyces sp. NPDC051546]|uniref:hypothetical protein n=1 Tax=Streptomyces sp. NPDC051546 TaxID=3365655 RepID=UPI0037B0126A
MDDIVAAAQQGPDHSGSTGRNDESTGSSETNWFEQCKVLPGGTVGSGKSSAMAQVVAQMQDPEQGWQGAVQVVLDLKVFVEQPEQVQRDLLGLLMAGRKTGIVLGDDVAAGE